MEDGGGKKKKKKDLFIYLFGTIFLCPPHHGSTESLEQTHWAELLFEQTCTCRAASDGTPAGLLAAAPSPDLRLSPDRK